MYILYIILYIIRHILILLQSSDVSKSLLKLQLFPYCIFLIFYNIMNVLNLLYNIIMVNFFEFNIGYNSFVYLLIYLMEIYGLCSETIRN